MDFLVALKPHHGHKKTARGRVPVALGQDLVLLNGVQVGIIGHGAGRPLCTIVRLDQDVAERLKAEVANLRSAAVGDVRQPPVLPPAEAATDWSDDDDLS